MIYNILEFGAAALFWWCCYRVWTAEDKDWGYGQGKDER